MNPNEPLTLKTVRTPIGQVIFMGAVATFLGAGLIFFATLRIPKGIDPIISRPVANAQKDILSMMFNFDSKMPDESDEDTLMHTITEAKFPEGLLLIRVDILLGGGGFFGIAEPSQVKDATGAKRYFHELWGVAVDAKREHRGADLVKWGTLLKRLLVPPDPAAPWKNGDQIGPVAPTGNMGLTPPESVKAAFRSFTAGVTSIDWSRDMPASEWSNDLVKTVDCWTIICFPQLAREGANNTTLRQAIVIAGPDGVMENSHELFEQAQKYLVAIWRVDPDSSAPIVEGPTEVTWPELVCISRKMIGVGSADAADR